MTNKLVVLASGTGSNFEAIAKACKDKKLNAKIELLIVNKQNAKAIDKAKKYGISYIYNDFKGENYYEIINVIKEISPTYIVLAGFLKVLKEDFVNTFYNKIINIHPSKLPQYKGLNAIKRAYENKDNEIGVTIHYVDEGVDTGKIISQEVVNVEGLNLEQAEEKVHKLEHKLYVETLKKLIEV